MHFHIFEVQLINRIAWDNSIRPPSLNELGWKDTVKIHPLQDTFVALRPIAPTNQPFDIPNSVRPLAPHLPIGAPLGNFPDPNGNANVAVVNHNVNFGWEYVWHCHILAHEENDLMHGVAIGVAPRAPTNLTASLSGTNAILNWVDNSVNETAFQVERATDSAFTAGLITYVVGANVTTFSDAIGSTGGITYYYRVYAANTIGDVDTPGFPTRTIPSGYSNSATLTTGTPSTPPAAPSNVASTAFRVGTRARITTTWIDNANNETDFQIQWATNSRFTQNLVTRTVGADITTFTTPNLRRRLSFYVRVRARNSFGVSAWVRSTPFPIITP
jgi:hypothetical protein